MKKYVFNKGFVELDGWMASDALIVKMARESVAGKKAVRSDRELIEHLLVRQRPPHEGPLEHCVFRFHVKTPVFVANQWMRHRIGSFSCKSYRYTKLTPEDVYIPDNADPAVIAYLQQSLEHYLELAASKHSNETARLVLPMAAYTQFFWTVNLRSVFNFLHQRMTPPAQYEMQVYAMAVYDLLDSVCPLAMDAYAKAFKS